MGLIFHLLELDLTGDSTGYFQSGIPFYTVHHLLSWTRMSSFHLSPEASAGLLTTVAQFLGGDLMFSRALYENGKVLMVHGYSVTVFDTEVPSSQYVRAGESCSQTKVDDSVKY